MQKAAKEKTFLLFFAIASALLLCAPSFASSIDVLASKTRAELFLLEGQNGTGQQAFHSAKHVENYDPSWGVASESLVAPNSAAGAADDIAFMGRGNQPFVEDLTHITGRTAASRNRAIDSLIREDLPNLRLTHQPQYSPFINSGLAKSGQGTHIGYKNFSSRESLRRVIVHEELHHRWFKRGIPGSLHHASDYVPDEKFYRVIDRYFKMRGWE